MGAESQGTISSNIPKTIKYKQTKEQNTQYTPLTLIDDKLDGVTASISQSHSDQNQK